MTSQAPAKPIIEPTLIETLKQLELEIFATLNCMVPGTVQSFNSAKGTVVVKAAFKSQGPDGSIIDSPLLLDCPVFTLQGGGGCILPPIAAGDQCVVMFADRHIDAWFKNGQVNLPSPDDNRTHDLSDGFAFIGVNSLQNVLAYVANTFRLKYGGSTIDLKSGQVLISNTSGAQINAIAGGLVQIKNATTSLAKALQDLCTALEGAQLDVTHSVFQPATIAAITAASVEIAAILST
jgi:hypothetical protein